VSCLLEEVTQVRSVFDCPLFLPFIVSFGLNDFVELTRNLIFFSTTIKSNPTRERGADVVHRSRGGLPKDEAHHSAFRSYTVRITNSLYQAKKRSATIKSNPTRERGADVIPRSRVGLPKDEAHRSTFRPCTVRITNSLHQAKKRSPTIKSNPTRERGADVIPRSRVGLPNVHLSSPAES
jgi:hypothetical protein